MARSAEPGCAIVDLAWIGAGVVDELSYRLNRQIVVDRESHPVDGHHADPREFLDRVVGQLLHQRNDGELPATSEVQRVAIVAPAAPPRLSTTNGLPNALVSRSAVMRPN